MVGALALKVVLLLTSQSMADGDEAVEGLMAMHVLNEGVHPIYPYGIQYGAGAFVEVHLAALLFHFLGVSDVTLKAAGGHNVAVLLCLVAVWLIERRTQSWICAILLPFAAFAHPIVVPFVGALAIYLVVKPKRCRPVHVLVALVGATSAAAYLLWPTGSGVWNPANQSLSLAGLLEAIPRVGANLFTSNLSARAIPEAHPLMTSAIWSGALILAISRSRRPRRLLLYGLAPFGVALLVQPDQLAARQLLLVYPIGCLLLASGLLSMRRVGAMLLGVLLLSGLLVQLLEVRSPRIYGPGVQARGVDRAKAREFVSALEAAGVHHVYCLDPMFQWNIVFLSRESIIARWYNPVDRVPRYAEMVDRARLSGRPVTLVGEVRQTGHRPAQVFGTSTITNPALFEEYFPRSPRLGTPPTKSTGDRPK
jgi:hypothetical protein